MYFDVVENPDIAHKGGLYILLAAIDHCCGVRLRASSGRLLLWVLSWHGSWQGIVWEPQYVLARCVASGLADFPLGEWL